MPNIQLSLSLVALVLMLTGCGGSSDSTSNSVPVVDFGPTAKITSEASMYENTSLSISGADSSDIEAPIQSFDWALEVPTGIDVSLNNSKQSITDVIAGELLEDLIVTLKLIVTDTAGQTSSAQIELEIKTLEGADLNDNGVRDDIEVVLESIYAVNDPKYPVIRDIAKNKQYLFTMKNLTNDQIKKNIEQSGLSSACLMFIGEDIENIMAQIESV